jgi:hypothetical protein
MIFVAKILAKPSKKIAKTLIEQSSDRFHETINTSTIFQIGRRYH